MMVFTHALLGAALAVPVLAVAPNLAPVALVAGAVGGVLPDLDVYAGHRRTLHFPVGLPPVAVAAVGVAALAPGASTVGVAWLLAGAALHAAADLLGGGLELRPWRATSERGVYSHYHGRWLAPRRWVPYDGSRRDLALATGAGGVLVAAFDGPVAALVGVVLVAAATYTLLRRWLPALWVAVADALPAAVSGRLPERFAERPSGSSSGPG